MARAYQKANGRYLRQNQWEDITLVMSLELGPEVRLKNGQKDNRKVLL